MIRIRAAAAALVALACALAALGSAHAADIDPRCVAQLPFGAPVVSGDHLTLVCHAGYVAMHDDDLLIPRWVAYRLTGVHTLGCGKRSNKFHAEADLPADRRATPADYTRSGYDRGHQAPAADFAWSKAESLDSFSMVNMAPQVGGLNRKQWERLEETVRAWALARGDLEIYVGPIMDGPPETIGKHHVAVPAAFFKVIVDRMSQHVLAFMAKNKDTPKGDLTPWLTSVSAIEIAAGIKLPLPDGVDRDVTARLWPADLKAWKRQHAKACRRHR